MKPLDDAREELRWIERAAGLEIPDFVEVQDGWFTREVALVRPLSPARRMPEGESLLPSAECCFAERPLATPKPRYRTIMVWRPHPDLGRDAAGEHR